MDINYLLIKSNAQIKEAITILENTDKGIVLVVDTKNILIGTVTDGDIRRGLLKGYDLNMQISNVMNKDMISIYEKTDSLLSKAESLMINNNITQIPVIDKKGQVLRLILRDDFDRSLNNSLPRVVIMAGGLGSRLHPLTENTPKPMLKVGQKPMLEIVLTHCIRAGLKEFYFAVNYLKEQIIEYFGDGSEWGVSINYLEEESPLGTAGPLQLLPIKDDNLILVLNGDILTNLDITNLINFHFKHSSTATICVKEYLESLPYGVVNIQDEKVISLEEKPTFSHSVSAGIYLINPTLLKFIEKGKPLDMPNLLTKAIEEKFKVTACPIHEYWLDVGQPETFKKANKDWGKRKNLNSKKL